MTVVGKCLSAHVHTHIHEKENEKRPGGGGKGGSKGPDSIKSKVW